MAECNQALLEEKTSRCKEKSEKIAQGLVQQKEASAEEAKLTAQQIEERLVAAEKNRLEQNEKGGGSGKDEGKERSRHVCHGGKNSVCR